MDVSHFVGLFRSLQLIICSKFCKMHSVNNQFCMFLILIFTAGDFSLNLFKILCFYLTNWKWFCTCQIIILANSVTSIMRSFINSEVWKAYFQTYLGEIYIGSQNLRTHAIQILRITIGHPSFGLIFTLECYRFLFSEPVGWAGQKDAVRNRYPLHYLLYCECSSYVFLMCPRPF